MAQGSSKLTSGKGAGFLPSKQEKAKSGVVSFKDPNTVKDVASSNPLVGAGEKGTTNPRIGDHKRKSWVPIGPTKEVKKAK